MVFQCNTLVGREHKVSEGKWSLSFCDTRLYCRGDSDAIKILGHLLNIKKNN